MDSKATLNAGDVCLDCQERDLVKYLRYFKINLNGDTILKCESNVCMYPYKNEVSSSSDDEEKTVGNFAVTNSLSLINDLIYQYDNSEEFQNTNNALQKTDNVSEQTTTHFDITLLDDLKEETHENECKTEIPVENYDYFADGIIASKSFTLPTLNTAANRVEPANDTNDTNDNKLSVLNVTADSIKNSPVKYEIELKNVIPTDINFTEGITKDCKSKIDIQSIETVKFEPPTLYNDLPTSSKNSNNKHNNIPSSNLNCAKTSEVTQIKKTKTIANSRRRKRPSSYLSSDIPKADIMKANNLLKKVAVMDIAKKPQLFKSPKGTRKYNVSKFDTGSDNMPSYSVDMISKMFFGKP